MKNIFLLMIIVFASYCYGDEVSGPAPDFTLKSNSGKNLRLSDMKGNVVLINFWASWCGPCRQEMPKLDALFQKYERLGFTIYGVNVDKEPAKAQTLLKDIPVTFPILFDPDGTVSELYKVRAMPTTMIVDRAGNRRYLHLGYKAGEEEIYQDYVKKLLRE